MKKTLFVSAALALVGSAGLAQAQNQLTTVRIASGFSRPLFVAAPPTDTGRLFVVEQRGSAGVTNRADIDIIDLATNTVLPTPFFSTASAGFTVTTGSEQGLLGFAFDPNYQTNGHFYINYTNSSGQTVVRRYTRDAGNPNITDYTSGITILTVTQPFSNHNGGWIGFGPLDNYLYIALGDGGSANDPNGNGLNLNALLGKMLRIDVSAATAANPYTIPPTNPFFGSTTARQEIWSYGLRNPWRNDFDPATGALYMADVGQNAFEELNYEPPLTGGRNYGWRCFEANTLFSGTTGGPSSVACPSLASAQTAGSGWTFPISDYGRTFGCSTTGGIVYRGNSIPWLRGTYFWSDYCNNWIRSINYSGSGNVPFASHTDRTAELAPGGGLAINTITSYGRDGNGEMYIVDQGGEIFKVLQRCYANCDGSSVVPTLNALDFSCFLSEFQRGVSLPGWAQNGAYANCDGSTIVPVLNALDFSCYLTRYAAGCP